MLAALLLASAAGGEWRDAVASERGFESSISRIRGDVRERVVGSSWRPGCPVALRDLRFLQVSFRNFDGEVKTGRLIVHERHAKRIVRVVHRLFDARFPIRRMNLIDRYGADDHASMNADNTSAFNCREVAGSPGVWSRHAYGKAIDINPVENPYVTASGYVSPPAGAAYTDRSQDAKGMIHRGDAVYDAFDAVGWEWGGDWVGTKDYQHFSSDGH